MGAFFCSLNTKLRRKKRVVHYIQYAVESFTPSVVHLCGKQWDIWDYAVISK